MSTFGTCSPSLTVPQFWMVAPYVPSTVVAPGGSLNLAFLWGNCEFDPTVYPDTVDGKTRVCKLRVSYYPGNSGVLHPGSVQVYDRANSPTLVTNSTVNLVHSTDQYGFLDSGNMPFGTTAGTLRTPANGGFYNIGLTLPADADGTDTVYACAILIDYE